MNGTDRRLIVLSIAGIGLAALLAGAVLGGLVIIRLSNGDDMPPGVAAYLSGLVLIATNSGALLAPSPLSKSSTATEQVEVVNEPDQPVPVADAE